MEMPQTEKIWTEIQGRTGRDAGKRLAVTIWLSQGERSLGSEKLIEGGVFYVVTYTTGPILPHLNCIGVSYPRVCLFQKKCMFFDQRGFRAIL